MKKNITNLHFNPAFTLAEVLITLGIIGIVAAMTISGLITEHQKRATVTKLQRAISIINQAYKLSYDELGDADAQTVYDELGIDNYIKTYWEPYLKFNLYCKDYSTCGYKSRTPLVFANGSKSSSYIIDERSRIGIQTADGFIYIIVASHSGGGTMFDTPTSVIWLDLNGSEGPNRFGRDVFQLARVQDKGVLPDCYNKTDSRIKSNCSKTSDGTCCAERIRRAGWNIEKDYPW